MLLKGSLWYVLAAHRRCSLGPSSARVRPKFVVCISNFGMYVRVPLWTNLPSSIDAPRRRDFFAGNISRHRQVHEELHTSGGDGAEAQARRILFGLGFDDIMQVVHTCYVA